MLERHRKESESDAADRRRLTETMESLSVENAALRETAERAEKILAEEALHREEAEQRAREAAERAVNVATSPFADRRFLELQAEEDKFVQERHAWKQSEITCRATLRKCGRARSVGSDASSRISKILSSSMRSGTESAVATGMGVGAEAGAAAPFTPLHRCLGTSILSQKRGCLSLCLAREKLGRLRVRSLFDVHMIVIDVARNSP